MLILSDVCGLFDYFLVFFRLHQVKVPTMIIHGGKDDICYPEGSQEMEKLLTSCPDKTIKIYDDLLHEVLNHKESFQVVLADLQAFWDSP